MNYEALLTHADFVRAIARSLILDQNAQDDVVQETWLAALQRKDEEIRSLPAWLATVTRNFARLQARKVNEGRFRGRQYFVRFVKRPADVKERYGDLRFESLGSATIRARVANDHDAIFTPCHYTVEEVTFLEGKSVADLHEIVSFRGRFSDQARVGEWAVARGSLEHVVPQAGPAYRRLIVGGRAGDYLLIQ